MSKRRFTLNHCWWGRDYDFLAWMLEETGLSFEEFCEQGMMGEMRYEKYKTDGFPTLSGKFELYAQVLQDMGISPLPIYREPDKTQLSTPELLETYPFVLTTWAKVRNFFHSEGRQIRSLRKGNADPLVKIHPDTTQSRWLQRALSDRAG